MSGSKEPTDVKIITSQNASQCTPYELRQELVRRNALDIPDDRCNYRTMLQRLMVELVKEEEALVAAKYQAIEDEKQRQRDEAKRERERKKQEALERSKQRQASNPNYFQQKQEVIEVPKPTIQEEITPTEDEETNPFDNNSSDDNDPFRTYKSSQRNRIFVK